MDDPTLLIPGIVNVGFTLSPLRKHLRSAGIDAQIIGSFPIRFFSVRHYAAKAAERIAAGPPDQTLVGWSMGGAIAIAAMSHPEARKRVRRVITYGTNFEGVAIAAIPYILGLRKAFGGDLCPSSPLVAELRQMIDDPNRPWDFIGLNGTRDVLAPGPQPKIPKRSRKSVKRGHMAITWDEQIFRMIEEYIRAPIPKK